MKKVLTIAGSDCSGGAGIQADLKTIMAHHVYGMSCITALTAQNTMGVSGILNVDGDFLEKQLEAVFTDIFPDAIKIGMVSQKELMVVIHKQLLKYKAKNIVVDPVMVTTSGFKLMADDVIEDLKLYLLPLADIITPNIPEAEILSEMKIYNKDDMEKAAQFIGRKYDVTVLLKGGHSVNDANDLYWENERIKWIKGIRIENDNTHGTGCTLSSAIASNLAKNYTMEQSIVKAKKYISGALNAKLNLGNASGPLDHGYFIQENEREGA